MSNSGRCFACPLGASPEEFERKLADLQPDLIKLGEWRQSLEQDLFSGQAEG